MPQGFNIADDEFPVTHAPTIVELRTEGDLVVIGLAGVAGFQPEARVRFSLPTQAAQMLSEGIAGLLSMNRKKSAN